MCLLTTQQRSGPNSPISKFLLTKPFPISLQECSQTKDILILVQNKLKTHGGIRFVPTIAKRMKKNFELLQSGNWGTLEQFAELLEMQIKSPPKPEHFENERKAAQYMDKTFSGFGPKQSRNFWQSMGLTRYEFVLDSRVLKWLRSMGFPIPLSTTALGNEEYYCFISDILRDWCLDSNILPCLLDAAIFASFDQDEWPEDAAIW